MSEIYKKNAEEYFKNDLFATKTSGIQIIDADKNYSKCMMKIDERHQNAAGFVMGGAIFTLADFAFAVASNQEGQWTVSVSSTIEYMNATKGPVLIAETECLKDGKNSVFYEISITDEAGIYIAKILTNGYKHAKLV